MQSSIQVGDKIKLAKKAGVFSRELGDTSTVIFFDGDGSFSVRHDGGPNYLLIGNLWLREVSEGLFKPHGMNHEFVKVESNG